MDLAEDLFQSRIWLLLINIWKQEVALKSSSVNFKHFSTGNNTEVIQCFLLSTHFQASLMLCLKVKLSNNDP